MVLAVTALLANEAPAIGLNQRKKFFDFGGHIHCILQVRQDMPTKGVT